MPIEPWEVTEALNKWMETRERLKDGGRCCFREHEDLSGGPIQDEFVCESELKWRRYVRLRDKNPRFPWEVQNFLGHWTYRH